jgi:K+-sensing histidine kinase KdpD
LRVEADRLTHLVENVLLYARLERSNPRRCRTRLPVTDLLHRFQQRLAQRVEQADMELQVDMSSEVAKQTVETDPAAVEQIVFNLVDNACKYAGDAHDRRIQIGLAIRHRGLELSVRDFGPGVSAHQARHLFRPFCKSADEAARSAPGVGLGLALCRRLAQDLGGQLTWKQDGQAGACFVLRLPIR